MRYAVLFLVALLSLNVHSQKANEAPLNLTNAVIIGQMDTPADRYSTEINLTELFNRNGVKAMPSLNLMKLGSDSQDLASDSIAIQAKQKGFDTFVLVTVRGYDRRYKPSSYTEDFKTALGRASLYGLYREDIVSATFEFKFYRQGELIHVETIKCGGAGSRDKVLSKMRKKVGKRIVKAWK